jgi:hypothetical protein
MIKFVCASCGERLSVPDQHGGRKGVCPTCKAINRIPLKGSAETQPNAPVVARPDGGIETPRLETGSSNAPATARSKTAVQPAPQPPALEVNPFALDPTFDDSPASYAPIQVERRLPKKLKLALLILAALAVVGALYFALYFALQTLIGKSE